MTNLRLMVPSIRLKPTLTTYLAPKIVREPLAEAPLRLSLRNQLIARNLPIGSNPLMTLMDLRINSSQRSKENSQLAFANRSIRWPITSLVTGAMSCSRC